MKKPWAIRMLALRRQYRQRQRQSGSFSVLVAKIRHCAECGMKLRFRLYCALFGIPDGIASGPQHYLRSATADCCTRFAGTALRQPLSGDGIGHRWTRKAFEHCPSGSRSQQRQTPRLAFHNHGKRGVQAAGPSASKLAASTMNR